MQYSIVRDQSSAVPSPVKSTATPYPSAGVASFGQMPPSRIGIPVQALPRVPSPRKSIPPIELTSHKRNARPMSSPASGERLPSRFEAGEESLEVTAVGTSAKHCLVVFDE